MKDAGKYRVLLSAVLLLSGCAPQTIDDHEKFAQEYTGLTSDNIFYYGDQENVKAMLEHGTGIVLFGFPECQWCQAYVVYLNEALLPYEVEVMYYDIKEDRQNDTAFYKELISILEDYLDYDNDGKARIYVPDLSFVIKGEIILHNNDTSQLNSDEISPAQYWDGDTIASFEEAITEAGQKVALARKENDEKGCDEGCEVTYPAEE